jgi:hypothetical protein
MMAVLGGWTALTMHARSSLAYSTLSQFQQEQGHHFQLGVDHFSERKCFLAPPAQLSPCPCSHESQTE